MAVNLEGGAPYAPSTAIIEFINRNRNGGVPAPVTLQTLERLGISGSLRPRTMQSLKQLDFVDDSGELAREFANLRKLSTPEYLPALAELLRGAYADVFAIVDPSDATYENVQDAFRGFTPAGQITRMVSLFLSLLDHTGEWQNLPSPRGGSQIATGEPVKKKVLRKLPSDGKEAERAALIRHAQEEKAKRERDRTSDGDTYRVTLNSGGEVAVLVNVNLFDLTTDDRDFVIELVDKLKGYPKAAQPATPKEAQTP